MVIEFAMPPAEEVSAIEMAPQRPKVWDHVAVQAGPGGVIVLGVVTDKKQQGDVELLSIMVPEDQHGAGNLIEYLQTDGSQLGVEVVAQKEIAT